MGYMTVEECRDAGYEPHAVVAGKVYSFWCLGFVIPHGSKDYENVLDDVRAAVHDEDLTAHERQLARDLEGSLLTAHLIRPSGGPGRKTEERPGTWWTLTLRGIEACAALEDGPWVT